MSKATSSLRNAEFRKYLLATVLTATGTGMHFIAMSWFVYQATSSASSLSWTLILTTLPGLILTPLVGVLVDRWDSKWICIVTDVLRGAILLCLIGSIHFRVWMVPTIYLTTFLLAVCAIFFNPAINALVRDVAGKDELLSANVASNTCFQTGMLAGASLGGILVAAYGAELVVILNMLSFFISAALTAWIKKQEGANSKIQVRTSVWKEFGSTLTYIWEHAFVLRIIVIQLVGTVTLFACNMLLPIFVKRELSAGAETFGIIDASWGGGAIAGGWVLKILVRRLSKRQLVLTSMLSLAGAIVIFLSAYVIPQAVIGYFLLGMIVSILQTSSNTELLNEVESNRFGKVKSTINMIISYFSLAVYAALGYWGDKASTRTFFAVVATIVLAGVVLINSFERWGCKPEPPKFPSS